MALFTSRERPVLKDMSLDGDPTRRKFKRRRCGLWTTTYAPPTPPPAVRKILTIGGKGMRTEFKSPQKRVYGYETRRSRFTGPESRSWSLRGKEGGGTERGWEGGGIVRGCMRFRDKVSLSAICLLGNWGGQEEIWRTGSLSG